MMSQFPEIFAIVRQAYRGPCLQILEAIPSELESPYSSYRRPFQRQTFSIRNCRDTDRFSSIEIMKTSMFDRDVHTYQIQQANMENPLRVKGWFLPYHFRVHGITVPVMDFQYRAWIPGEYTQIPIRTNIVEFMRISEDIQILNLRHIQRNEDTSQNIRSTFESFHRHGPDDYDDRESYSPNTFVGAGADRRRRHTYNQSPEVQIEYRERIVEVPVEVERIVHTVVVQSKPLPLPKSVGDLLIDQARKGTDSCPIAAIPFAECEKIVVSSCFHLFDKASLERWQETHTSCPVCRCKIENIVSE